MKLITNLNLCKDRNDFYVKLNAFLEMKSKGYTCLVNPNVLVHCHKYLPYFEVVRSANFNLCDAISIEMINNLSNNVRVKSLPGPDIFDEITRNQNYSQFFIGGENKALLSSLKNNLKNKSFKDTDFHCPPFLNVEDFDYENIANLINNKNPDIIWIGLGAPKQEIFMSKLLPHIESGLMIGVGAAFNFYSGYNNYKRAPVFYRRYKLEWLFRLIYEPKKTIPRVIQNTLYLPLILFNELR